VKRTGKLDLRNAQGRALPSPNTIDAQSSPRAGATGVALARPALPPIWINNRAELAQAAAELRDRINEAHMLAGVTIVDPKTTGSTPASSSRPTWSSTRSPSRGATQSRLGREIGPHAVAIDAAIGARVSIGPFCYLRPGTVLDPDAKAGTFVEIKNSRIGAGTKIPHLSYIGDADIGEGRTSPPGTSPRTSRTRRASRRAGRRSAATSGPGSTMGSLHQSRWGTTHGSRPDR
jgi:bifunctional UDP-N-acetylglucosamine pyrophosphorylase/glucosamine-1-phosphate N-acetyltransferase